MDLRRSQWVWALTGAVGTAAVAGLLYLAFSSAGSGGEKPRKRGRGADRRKLKSSPSADAPARSSETAAADEEELTRRLEEAIARLGGELSVADSQALASPDDLFASASFRGLLRTVHLNSFDRMGLNVRVLAARWLKQVRDAQSQHYAESVASASDPEEAEHYRQLEAKSRRRAVHDMLKAWTLLDLPQNSPLLKPSQVMTEPINVHLLRLEVAARLRDPVKMSAAVDALVPFFDKLSTDSLRTLLMYVPLLGRWSLFMRVFRRLCSLLRVSSYTELCERLEGVLDYTVLEEAADTWAAAGDAKVEDLKWQKWKVVEMTLTPLRRGSSTQTESPPSPIGGESKRGSIASSSSSSSSALSLVSPLNGDGGSSNADDDNDDDNGLPGNRRLLLRIGALAQLEGRVTEEETGIDLSDLHLLLMGRASESNGTISLKGYANTEDGVEVCEEYELYRVGGDSTRWRGTRTVRVWVGISEAEAVRRDFRVSLRLSLEEDSQAWAEAEAKAGIEQEWIAVTHESLPSLVDDTASMVLSGSSDRLAASVVAPLTQQAGR